MFFLFHTKYTEPCLKGEKPFPRQEKRGTQWVLVPSRWEVFGADAARALSRTASNGEWMGCGSVFFFFFFYNFILFCLFGLRLLPENRQSRVLCSLFFLEPSHLQQSSATAFPDQWAFLPINMYRPPGDFKSVRSPFSYGTHARTTATSKTLCWIQHLVLYKRVHFH